MGQPVPETVTCTAWCDNHHDDPAVSVCQRFIPVSGYGAAASIILERFGSESPQLRLHVEDDVLTAAAAELLADSLQRAADLIAEAEAIAA